MNFSLNLISSFWVYLFLLINSHISAFINDHVKFLLIIWEKMQ